MMELNNGKATLSTDQYSQNAYDMQGSNVASKLM
jgi:hypothetical protein